jgi:hypothetical protein
MRTIETTGAGTRSGAGPAQGARGRARPIRWWVPYALAAALWQSPAVHADTLFDTLMGSWAGAGKIRYDDGQAEDIRCTAYYTGGGDQLRMAIRCRSTSTEVEIRGQLTVQGERLAGTWEERTFNASGEASGRVAGDKMSLSVTGGGFKGSMSVTSAGAKQTVTISTDGIRMRSVNVTLGKS